MAAKRKLLTLNNKGGVGKSMTLLVMAEWFLHKKKSISLVDASGNPTTKEYLENCEATGRDTRPFSHPKPYVELIDTKGEAAAAAPFYNEATNILIPFQADAAAVSDTEKTFDNLSKASQHKVIFVFNFYGALIPIPKDSRDSYQAVIELAEDEDLPLIWGLCDRKAIYPPIYKGLQQNWFDLRVPDNPKKDQSLANAHFEVDRMCKKVLEIVNKESSGYERRAASGL